MDISGNAVKNLGKRLRNTEVTDTDLVLLEDYRASFDPLLVNTSLQLDDALAQTGIPYLVSGRSKRTKSIIRKLRRPQNHGMDLSRISDMVGLRVLVENVGQQQSIFECVCRAFSIKDVDDYRNAPQVTGYRSAHIIVRDGKRLLEIQLRTLPQHLWAVESEAFGEKVKEGSATGDVLEYLNALRDASAQLDAGHAPDEASHPAPFMDARRPLTGKFPRLLKLFREAAKCEGRGQATASYLIVFDRQLGELVHDFPFGAAAREEATCNYRKLCREIDESKMDVLIINSPSRIGIEVTHPQFF